MSFISLLFLALSQACGAFQVTPPPASASRATTLPRGRLNYATSADLPVNGQPALFEERMRKLVLKNNSRSGPKPGTITATTMPDNMHEALNLQEYARLVGEETEKVTVVRFYAPWCRACKRVEAPFERLARQHPEMKFVQLPMSDSTRALIGGLGVSAIPYGHVYHPTAGLVEEKSMNKQYFVDFASIVDSYAHGECPLPDEVDPYSGVYESPYHRYRGQQRKQEQQEERQLRR